VAEPEPARQVRHEVRRQLDLVDAIGCAGADERLSLRVPEAARSRVADRLATLGLHRRPWVLVHPGATAASRRYPPARFAAAARGVARATRCAVVVTGAAAERPLVDDVLAALDGDAHALVGLGLADFAALVEAAPLLITNNSGPVHVAAAVGTPVIDLYALTNPQHTPWAVPHRVLFRDVPCKYCYKSVCPEGHGNCLALVEPAEVVEAALALLQERDP
jgi:ADP-heptose:LPS heptosyltransferase